MKTPETSPTRTREDPYFDPPPLAQYREEWESARRSVAPDYRGPVQTGMRRTPAIWNILGSLGTRVGVLGWWATWPAEPVNGFLVSSYVKNRLPLNQPDAASETRRRRLQLTFTGTVYEDPGLRQTYPDKFIDELGPIIERAESLDDAAILADLPSLAGKTSQPMFFDLKWNYIANEIYTDAALLLLREKDVQAVFVVQHGVDVAYHRDPVQLLGGYYQYVDRRLGELVASSGPDANILVTSEHGTRGPLPHELGPTEGIFIAAGRRIRHGSVLTADTVDVVPTVLAWLDQPLAKTLDGRVLEEIFTDEYRLEWRRRVVESYEWASPPLTTELDLPRFDRAIERRLDRIGYPQDADGARALK